MAKDQVTLIATDTITPYFKGDVFTVDKDVAEALLDKNHRKHPKDEDGNPLPVKVEEYDGGNKKHVEILNRQRGKTEDAPAPAAYSVSGNPPAANEVSNNPAGDRSTSTIPDAPGDERTLGELKRAELDEIATEAGVENPKDLPNREAVIEAIEAKRNGGN